MKHLLAKREPRSRSRKIVVPPEVACLLEDVQFLIEPPQRKLPDHTPSNSQPSAAVSQQIEEKNEIMESVVASDNPEVDKWMAESESIGKGPEDPNHSDVSLN
eukprot:c7064_g1_i5.p1 GENE.c7064_g1_i5~~c7064_g1_i5.p1  ORF type:complete len:103 (+),score=22.84 c7064_g1_i5:280-588(+)